MPQTPTLPPPNRPAVNSHHHPPFRHIKRPAVSTPKRVDLRFIIGRIGRDWSGEALSVRSEVRGRGKMEGGELGMREADGYG